MASPDKIPQKNNEFEQIQRQKRTTASDPLKSTWISAHAGSGKTTVLTQRYLRILLQEENVDKILCLTFTRTGAALILQRVHQTVQKWIVMDDQELKINLQEFVEHNLVNDKIITKARQLFARILDMPKGLKIQTIHSFAESMLRFFSIETDTNPGFEVIDEWKAEQLLKKAIQSVFEEQEDEKQYIRKAHEIIIENGVDITQIVKEIVNAVANDPKYQNNNVEKFLKDFYREKWPHFNFDIDKKNLQYYLERQFEDLIQQQLWQEIEEKIDKENKFHKQKQIIQQIIKTTQKKEKILQISQLVLDENTKIKQNHFTKWLLQQEEKIANIAYNCQTIHQQYNALKQLELCLACNLVADRCQKRYQEIKLQNNAIDYADLMVKLHQFLTKYGSKFIAYKNGVGLEHLLIDEAQDNSRLQWQILQLLSTKFTSTTAVEVGSLFVVGDYKQSIFGFQGADPRYFLQWEKKTDQNLHKIQLDFSFRSAKFLLNIVDKVLQNEFDNPGENKLQHQGYQKPARIEIWKLVVNQNETEKESKNKWKMPTQYSEKYNSAYQLGEKIAENILQWKTKGLPKPFEKKILRLGDILILLRRRGNLMAYIRKALKKRDIAIADADRIILQNEPPVMDLVNIARWALNPLDDLALAIALKGSFFRFSENQIIKLCVERKNTLWQHIAENRQQKNIDEAYKKLLPLIYKVRKYQPYQFFIDFLYAQNAIADINQIFATMALEPIQIMLEKAYLHSQQQTSAMQGFIHDLVSNTTNLKRQSTADDNQVQIMSVHAAKGMEADIVIIPDAHNDILNIKPMPLNIKNTKNQKQENFLIHTMGKKQYTLLDEKVIKEYQQYHTKEANRLLYVAMTRARHMLVVAGYANKKISDNCWYSKICQGLELNTDQKGNLLETYIDYYPQNT